VIVANIYIFWGAVAAYGCKHAKLFLWIGVLPVAKLDAERPAQHGCGSVWDCLTEPKRKPLKIVPLFIKKYNRSPP
jgi:hypothetical protein